MFFGVFGFFVGVFGDFVCDVWCLCVCVFCILGCFLEVFRFIKHLKRSKKHPGFCYISSHFSRSRNSKLEPNTTKQGPMQPNHTP